MNERCRQCRTGYVPGEVKTFTSGCPGCQRKLAAGLRTGKEPLPVAYGTHGAPRLSEERFRAFVERGRREKIGRREA